MRFLPNELQNCGKVSDCRQWCSTKEGESSQDNWWKGSESSRIWTRQVAPNAHSRNLRVCRYCSKKHKFGAVNCSAFNKTCQFCGKLNHVADACWKKHRDLYRPRLSSCHQQKNHCREVQQPVKIEENQSTDEQNTTHRNKLKDNSIDSSEWETSVEEEMSFVTRLNEASKRVKPKSTRKR